ncbi:MAG: hypothetical protein WBD81_17865 [Collimonas pratensis]|uniref:hypothetical protein n=1 Tax=Collimonas pratensis TaxID=279113 RepID=UPI003C7780FB
MDYGPFPTIVGNTLGTEFSSTYPGTFAPIEPGTPFTPANHSVADTTQFEGMIFLRQTVGESREFQKQVWATPPTLQDLYNYEVTFSGDAASYPIFKRRYLVLRDGYAPLANLSVFTSVYAIAITAAGSGYKNPVVSISGGSGSGATAIAIASPINGGIVKITLKSEGAGYATAPTVTISDSGGGTGSGATAVAAIQPSNCLLVEEQVVRTPDKDWDSLYFIVERTYETLPGPWMYDTAIAEDSDVITIARRHNIPANITSGEGFSGGTLTKTTEKAITAVVSWEIVETRALPGPALTSYAQDPETGAVVTITRQLVASSAFTPSAGSAGTEQTAQAIDDYVTLVTTRTISSTTPPGRNEYHSNEYPFPSRIYGVTFAIAVATDGTTILTLNYNKISGRRLNVMQRVAISYSATEPDLNSTITIYNFPIQDLIYSGVFFSVDEPRVLNNAFTLTYSAGSASILWPDFVETFVAAATSLTATEYDALLGTEILIGGQTVRWNYFLWRQELIYTKVMA